MNRGRQNGVILTKMQCSKRSQSESPSTTSHTPLPPNQAESLEYGSQNKTRSIPTNGSQDKRREAFAYPLPTPFFLFQQSHEYYIRGFGSTGRFLTGACHLGAHHEGEKGSERAWEELPCMSSLPIQSACLLFKGSRSPGTCPSE